jgi:hypothetical protein
MVEDRIPKSRWITSLILFLHLLANLIATACLWWWGNWEEYGWALSLTLRILWGVWIVHLLALVLTRVTIFGWNFRRYFRPTGEGKPPAPPLRPIRAPWYKSGKVSFAMTVVLVSLTGACAIATAVMYILKDATGPRVFWVVGTSIWSGWWVSCIAVVVTRVTLFGRDKKKGDEAGPNRPPASAKQSPLEGGS